MAGHDLWSPKVRKRANAEHARKKRAKKQRRHLLRIKSKADLRQMRLACRAG